MKQTEGLQETDAYNLIEVPLLVEDLPRTPIEIRKIEDSEFVTYAEEQMKAGEEALGRIMAETRYNSMVLASVLFSAYEDRQDETTTLLDVFREIKIGPEIDSQEMGATCIGMAQQMKDSLQELGISSFLMGYKSRGLVNSAGDEYVGVSHTAAVVPSIEAGKQVFTIFDSGLLIPVPIRFVSGEDSPKLFFRNKYCQAVCGSDDTAYPYTFIIAERSDVSGADVESAYSITDKAPFDPYHEYINPYDTLAKDYLRATQGFRITRQNRQGENLGYVAVDLLQQVVKLKFSGLEYHGEQGKVGIPFANINLEDKDSEESRLIATLADNLGVSPEYLTTNIGKLMFYRDYYVSSIYAPSVREALLHH